MTTYYTITNICPKKKFYSEDELKKYCATHMVPAGYSEFIVEKTTVDDEFKMPGKSICGVNVDITKVVELIRKIADAIENHAKHIEYEMRATPFNSYYYESFAYTIPWMLEYLRSVKPEHIKKFLSVHTDYMPCNNFCICIDTRDLNTINAFCEKYNKAHPNERPLIAGELYSYHYHPFRGNVVHKTARPDPKDVDFSTWTEEELEFFKVCESPRPMCIQFRNDDIMIDSSCYTGHHVNHRQNYDAVLDQKRYDWCLDRIKGIQKKNYLQD